jgi:hypothetical protein
LAQPDADTTRAAASTTEYSTAVELGRSLPAVALFGTTDLTGDSTSIDGTLYLPNDGRPY